MLIRTCFLRSVFFNILSRSTLIAYHLVGVSGRAYDDAVGVVGKMHPTAEHEALVTATVDS